METALVEILLTTIQNSVTVQCPPDIQLACHDPIPAADPNSVIAVSDCTGAIITISHTDKLMPANCTGQQGIDHTWTATDTCGSSSSCVPHITYADTAPPEITCPADIIATAGRSCSTTVSYAIPNSQPAIHQADGRSTPGRLSFSPDKHRNVVRSASVP
jgi:hypothetical protein